jgi:hypothetical protein
MKTIFVIFDAMLIALAIVIFASRAEKYRDSDRQANSGSDQKPAMMGL